MPNPHLPRLRKRSMLFRGSIENCAGQLSSVRTKHQARFVRKADSLRFPGLPRRCWPPPAIRAWRGSCSSGQSPCVAPGGVPHWLKIRNIRAVDMPGFPAAGFPAPAPARTWPARCSRASLAGCAGVCRHRGQWLAGVAELRELTAPLESLEQPVSPFTGAAATSHHPHRNPTSPGRSYVSPQVSHRQNGIPRHTAAHLLRWPCKPVTSIYADQAG